MRNGAWQTARSSNHVPLTPVEFLVRAVEVWPNRPAVIWNGQQWTYAEFGQMVGRFARFLRSRGIGSGDVVSFLAPNRPELLAAHYAVPMLGAVLNAINTRLDSAAVRYIVGHAESRLTIADSSLARLVEDTECVILADQNGVGGLNVLSGDDSEQILDTVAIVDEWQPICLNYTSGTTGQPKGVIYHHRGAYLNALGNVLALGLDQDSVYLWTLPMFHCNGWCHTWAVTAAGAAHVCLDRPDPALIFPAIRSHRVTHMACAPVVLYMMLNHPDKAAYRSAQRLTIATGGAAPSAALIAELDSLGFDLLHLYGLTESFGPATLRALNTEEQSRSPADKAAALARQGMRHLTSGRVRVVDANGKAVPSDGSTQGEIVLRGNTLMAGYYRDDAATMQAFDSGAFRTGDLGVCHSDGNIEIRDRAKDIIISGGENISSLEIESVLHGHPSILLVAVVAAPHKKWGETPVAFVELRQGATLDAESLRSFCRARLAHFKVPGRFVEAELPKTATGKVQKFTLRAMARELVSHDE